MLVVSFIYIYFFLFSEIVATNCTPAQCGNSGLEYFCLDGDCTTIACNTSDQCPRLPYAPEDLCYVGTCVEHFCMATDCLEIGQICISNAQGCSPRVGATGPPPPVPTTNNNAVVLGLSFTTVGLILLICCILLVISRFTGRRDRSIV